MPRPARACPLRVDGHGLFLLPATEIHSDLLKISPIPSIPNFSKEGNLQPKGCGLPSTYRSNTLLCLWDHSPFDKGEGVKKSNPPISPFFKFFKGGLSTMETRISLCNGWRFRAFDPSPPLCKRGVRGDFSELAIGVIIFSHFQGEKRGI